MAKKDLEPKEEKMREGGIISIDIVPEMKESYLAYAMSVITARA